MHNVQWFTAVHNMPVFIVQQELVFPIPISDRDVREQVFRLFTYRIVQWYQCSAIPGFNNNRFEQSKSSGRLLKNCSFIKWSVQRYTNVISLCKGTVTDNTPYPPSPGKCVFISVKQFAVARFQRCCDGIHAVYSWHISFMSFLNLLVGVKSALYKKLTTIRVIVSRTKRKKRNRY